MTTTGVIMRKPVEECTDDELAALARSYTPMIIVKMHEIVNSDADPAIWGEAKELLERALRLVDAGRSK